ncbi:YdcF family protein [Pseudolabrys taiwanensis]|uniref:YdcF family protein n=1 Tax=Pseudolabrys taiwanensis TaxID=331696 RepID=A0A345ZTT5_9HYPH|nr:YdcF family protein [Pseudolabrys taiwanensis]AXK80332.1 YdcF family protein [Pseudolabrys taiwanensis]
MFFVLSKTIGFLLLPSNLLILCGVVGAALLLTPWRRLGAWLAGGSVVLVALLSLLPVGALLLSTLESRFPPWRPTEGAPDGIVVLGGAFNTDHSRAYGVPMLNSDAGRLVALAKLARDYPNARIVYTGGDASLLGNGEPEADFVYPLLDALGVPRSRVMLESKSRNTQENAVLTKQLVQPKAGERWLLVTSAFHMPRAIGCFRKAGFDVEAYPANWYTLPSGEWEFKRSVSSGLRVLDLAVHEWLGLIAYRLTGKTDALLPSP